MPYAHHVARCFHCGKEWMVGDFIPMICDECLKKGHAGIPCFPFGEGGCPACERDRQERRERAEAEKRAEEEARKRRDAMVLFDSHAGRGSNRP